MIPLFAIIFDGNGGNAMTRTQKRVFMAVLGVLACGLVVALMRTANFGSDPYTVLMLGVANQLGWEYHTVYLLATAVLLAVVFFWDRKFIGFATFVNLFLVGYVADFFMWLFQTIGLEPTLIGRVALLIGALALVCVASSLYFTADMGVSSYDALSLIAAKRKVASLRVCRVATDLLCVLAGWLMGATVGIGTVLVALCMGPAIQWLNRVMSEPFLNRSRNSAKSC